MENITGLRILPLIGLLIPNFLLLVFFVPLSIILSTYTSVIPPVYSIASVTIRIQDLLILLVAFKLLISNHLYDRLLRLSVYEYTLIFLWVLFSSTLIAYYKFGFDIFLNELYSFLRFILQALVFFLLPYSLNKIKNIKLAGQYFQAIGYIIGFTLYLSMILYVFWEIKFGEVQDSGSLVRYFGPIGDQIGFIVSLFCFKELVAGRMILAALFGFAVFATVTRGAIIALAVGLIAAFFVQNKKLNWKSIRNITGIFLLLGILAIFSGFGKATIIRFISPTAFDAGLLQGTVTETSQRVLTLNIALKIFFDNIITGVGFGGFRLIAPQYGAENLFAEGLLQHAIANTSNQYLQVATDSGILGLFIFILLMKSSLWLLKLASDYSESGLRDLFLAGRIWLWSLLIGNQTAAWMLPDSIISNLFWILLGIAAATVTVKRRIKHQSKDDLTDLKLIN